MIKAIIFDCYGVLATDGWLPYKYRYFGHDKQLFDEAGELQRQVDAGLEDYGHFLRVISEKTGIGYEETKKQFENNIPNEELFDYIANQLKGHVKLGMLSNAGNHRLYEIFTPEQIKLFDVINLSYETGYVKPDPRAYAHIAEQLGVEPEECMFVDDVERYVTAGNEAGMHAIWYKLFEHARDDINQKIISTTDQI